MVRLRWVGVFCLRGKGLVLMSLDMILIVEDGVIVGWIGWVCWEF